MDVHPPKNGIYRYLSIAKSQEQESVVIRSPWLHGHRPPSRPRPGDIRLRLWDQTDSHPWPARKPCMPRTKCLPRTFGQRMTKDDKGQLRFVTFILPRRILEKEIKCTYTKVAIQCYIYIYISGFLMLFD